LITACKLFQDVLISNVNLLINICHIVHNQSKYVDNNITARKLFSGNCKLFMIIGKKRQQVIGIRVGRTVETQYFASLPSRICQHHIATIAPLPLTRYWQCNNRVWRIHKSSIMF